MTLFQKTSDVMVMSCVFRCASLDEIISDTIVFILKCISADTDSVCHFIAEDVLLSEFCRMGIV